MIKILTVRIGFFVYKVVQVPVGLSYMIKGLVLGECFFRQPRFVFFGFPLHHHLESTRTAWNRVKFRSSFETKLHGYILIYLSSFIISHSLKR